MDRDGFIRLERLCKGYPEGDRIRHVLQDTTLHISKGEAVAILGRSGSGKTTLLNLISAIDRADCGEVWLDGTNITSLNDHEQTLFRRSKIGFIFQFFNLIPTLTVWENLVLPLELNGGVSPDDHRRAEETLQATGLLDRREVFPDRLSGGEQQRVAIARAIIHDPLVVLADEPTGNLDEETGRQVLDLLDRFTRKAGKNLILVTHSLEAASYADRVFALRDGHLVEMGKKQLER